jgi:hypothetical protein
MGDVRAVTARFPQIYGVTKSTHGLSEFLENSTHNLDPVYGGNEKIHPIYGGAALNRLIAVSQAQDRFWVLTNLHSWYIL